MVFNRDSTLIKGNVINKIEGYKYGKGKILKKMPLE